MSYHLRLATSYQFPFGLKYRIGAFGSGFSSIPSVAILSKASLTARSN